MEDLGQEQDQRDETGRLPESDDGEEDQDNLYIKTASKFAEYVPQVQQLLSDIGPHDRNDSHLDQKSRVD